MFKSFRLRNTKAFTIKFGVKMQARMKGKHLTI